MAPVKTTLEIPDPLFRQLKISAAKQGKTIRMVVNEALVEKLNRRPSQQPELPAWRATFGGLRALRSETARISGEIEAEFSRVNPEDWK
jgi:predicted transcriptional regulator